MNGRKEYIVPVYDVDADEFREYIGFIRTKQELIRCKDCNWFRESNGETQCVLWDYATTNKNAFCFYASRKQTGADYAGFEVYEAERPE